MGRRAPSITTGRQLREAVLASPTGGVKTAVAGWSVLCTGGPNDTIGGAWRLSGKRLDGRRPSELNLAWLRRFAIDAGADDVDGREVIAGTWHWMWGAGPELTASFERLSKTTHSIEEIEEKAQATVLQLAAQNFARVFEDVPNDEIDATADHVRAQIVADAASPVQRDIALTIFAAVLTKVRAARNVDAQH